MMPDLTPILRIREVAAYLKIHPSTVYRMARAGELPMFRLSHDWRIRQDILDAWLDERSRPHGKV
jgi:excisionase family DNA binding protein